MKILFIDPAVHSAKSATYHHYNYLYDRLKMRHYHEVFLYNKTSFNNIGDVLMECHLNNFKPDIIFFGMGWFALKPTHFSKNLHLDKVDIPAVGFLFKPQNFLEEKIKFLKNNNFDLIISSVPQCDEYQEKSGIECKLLSQAGDPRTFYDRKIDKIYDIGFSGALHDNHIYVDGAFKTFNIRSRAQDLLREQEGISAFLNGSDDVAARIPSYEEYAKKISQCKMWIATPAPFEEITGRYYEIGMAKTLLFCSEVPEIYKDVLRDGENCVIFSNDLSDFLDKFYYYRDNWEITQQIIENSYKEFHSAHTWEQRVEFLLSYFKEVLEK